MLQRVEPHPRRFRFGVSVRAAESLDAWQALARKAEDLGFDILHVADHLVDMFPPLTPLTAAAQATKRLRVGTLVLNNDFRHPAFVAREAATIDLLTGGRFELGLGAGHTADEYASAGIAFDSAPVRVTRLEESVGILRRLLSGEEVSFDGEHYSLEAQRSFPMPSQRPLPLLVGGNGRRVLSIAARHADIVGFTGISHSPDGREASLRHLSERALSERIAIVSAAAGERFDALELNCLVQSVVITDQLAPALEAIAKRSPGIAPDALPNNPFLFVGAVDQVVDELERRREELGVSYYVVFEHSMEALAPVIARLAGH